MRYGEAETEDELDLPRPQGTDGPIYVARDVSVGLYRLDEPKGEIFPPSTGEMSIIGDEVVCKKHRAQRAPVPLAVPSGPHVIVDRTVVREDGVQWMTFRVNEVQDTGRTMLLRYKVEVEDEEGRYEILLDSGSRSQRLVSMLKRSQGVS
jgi:hypothetical protein